jgi:hypothetical protein
VSQLFRPPPTHTHQPPAASYIRAKEARSSFVCYVEKSQRSYMYYRKFLFILLKEAMRSFTFKKKEARRNLGKSSFI